MPSNVFGYTTRYPSFQPDPTASLIQNFNRLAVEQKWKKKSAEYRAERKDYLTETVHAAFLSQFGNRVNSLEAWQDLCWTIGVSPGIGEDGKGTEVVLPSIKACRKALKGVFVNLVDLVEAGARNQRISVTFESKTDLAGYINETGKIFPCVEAMKNPLMQRFLIVVSEH